MKELTAEQEDFLLEEARERDWERKRERDTKVTFSYSKKEGLQVLRVIPSSLEVCEFCGKKRINGKCSCKFGGVFG